MIDLKFIVILLILVGGVAGGYYWLHNTKVPYREAAPRPTIKLQPQPMPWTHGRGDRFR